MSCACQPSAFPSTPSGIANRQCTTTPCQNEPFLPNHIEPLTYSKEDRIYPLNALGIRLDGTAVPVTNDLQAPCSNGWVYENPLTYDAPRAQRLVFDRPTYTGQVNVGNVCQDEIYSPAYSDYGKGYKNYMDINAGQIQYYLNGNGVDAYTSPVFSTPSTVSTRLFVDPMRIVKPQYDRQPLTPYSWKQPYDGCDSATHDTLEFRQDLMARQMRKRNQQTWEYRWGHATIDDPSRFASPA
jgi:hypothetical protein